MGEIKILDCTLRDGGYCNDWLFGEKNIQKILTGLTVSGLDYVECGFLTDTVKFNPNITKFNSIDQVNSFLPENAASTLFVVMSNYGEYNFNTLPIYSGHGVCGIRLAFHKKDIGDAIKLGRIIVDKGYRLFLQPMVSLCYSDEEFLSLINKANSLCPYAFYIVDSFGEMKRKDLTRLFYMVEHNLNEQIKIGFHSHNNMQLAYSNAQRLVEMQSSRNLIIDSSVYGMGRGAGNLNTELFIEYLNDMRNTRYGIKPLLNIIDEVLESFYQQKKWGYSLPNYLSALHSAHPNYAFYLDERKTLTVEGMNDIFLSMNKNKKNEFDKEYIEKVYTDYMFAGKAYEKHKAELISNLVDKEVLLIAPGKSSEIYKDKIITYSQKNEIVSISINFDYPHYQTNYVFIGNMRRFREFPKEKLGKCIVTSNIQSNMVYFKANYKTLLNDVSCVRDNSGLMAIKFLIDVGVKKITLVGFDGYSHDNSQNYADKSLTLIMNNTLQDEINIGMKNVLEKYGKIIEIEYIH